MPFRRNPSSFIFLDQFYTSLPIHTGAEWSDCVLIHFAYHFLCFNFLERNDVISSVPEWMQCLTIPLFGTERNGTARLLSHGNLAIDCSLKFQWQIKSFKSFLRRPEWIYSCLLQQNNISFLFNIFSASIRFWQFSYAVWDKWSANANSDLRAH